jgi:hypothetical protein
VQAAYELTSERALRKRFHVSASDDNPIVRGKVKFRLGAKVNPSGATCTLDGKLLESAGLGSRFSHPTLDFDIPTDLLSPGEHEVVLSMRQGTASVLLYPDIVQPYHPPLLGKAQRVPDSAFATDPWMGNEELAKLSDVL